MATELTEEQQAALAVIETAKAMVRVALAAKIGEVLAVLDDGQIYYPDGLTKDLSGLKGYLTVQQTRLTTVSEGLPDGP